MDATLCTWHTADPLWHGSELTARVARAHGVKLGPFLRGIAQQPKGLNLSLGRPIALAAWAHGILACHASFFGAGFASLTPSWVSASISTAVSSSRAPALGGAVVAAVEGVSAAAAAASTRARLPRWAACSVAAAASSSA